MTQIFEIDDKLIKIDKSTFESLFYSLLEEISNNLRKNSNFIINV
jgi:hypothetical protein